MYPPLTSPTSPQDVPMTDLNILNTQTVLPQKLISTTSPTSSLSSTSSASSSPILPTNDQYHQKIKKSTDTLRNNIDFKNEMYKKRTSLKIENGSNMITKNNHNNNNNGGNSTEDITKTLLKDNCIDNARHSIILSKSQRNSRNFDNHNGNDSTTSNSDAESAMKNGNGTELDNRKFRRVKRRNNKSDANIDKDVDKEEEADYNDTKNGSASDSTNKRDSVTSKCSSDDYFLCEKFKNSLNAKLNGESEADGIVNGNAKQAEEPMDLLSPNEVPLGRRYAEITPAKSNKW